MAGGFCDIQSDPGEYKMKPFIYSTLSLTLLFGTTHAQSVPKIGVLYVYSADGKQDRAYNQSVAEGISRAAADFKVELQEYLPKQLSNDPGINAFIKEKHDLLIGVGFQSEAPISKAAIAKPKSSYALVDAQSSAKNVRSISFREEEGSYLVGYIAALKTSTGVIGFVGGMDIPIIKKFEAGFVAGARAARKDIKVFSATLGNTPKAFSDPEGAKKLAATLKAKGADIIFAAAGKSGDGVIAFVTEQQCIKASELPKQVSFRSDAYKAVPKSAAYLSKCAGNTRPMFFIGVDTNQNYLGDTDSNPKTLNHGLTSMVKNMDIAVYRSIADVVSGSFSGGNRSYGLNENGVGFAYDSFNADLITRSEYSTLQKVYRQVATGGIQVPTARPK